MSRTQKKLILVSLVVLFIDCASVKFRDDYTITLTSVGADGGQPQTAVLR